MDGQQIYLVIFQKDRLFESLSKLLPQTLQYTQEFGKQFLIVVHSSVPLDNILATW